MVMFSKHWIEALRSHHSFRVIKNTQTPKAISFYISLYETFS